MNTPTFQQRINDKEFDNTDNYPKRPSKPKLSSTSPSADELTRYTKLVCQYEIDIAKYNSECDMYDNKTNELLRKFHDEALDDVGLSTHPKKELIWGKAWDDGHSHGASSVYGELLELSEFIEKFESK